MIKKLLTYSVVITTALWSVGLLATPLAVGAAVSGDLIKLQCATGADVNDPCRAVYYLGADSKRYVFPNEKTYKTWYSDFSGVQTVSSTEMSSYSIGGNVTYRPGVKMVKITTDPKVYAVAGNGSLMWVTTAAIAEALYGSGWASMIEDVPDAFFVNYSTGSNINAAGDYNKENEMGDSTTINADKNLVLGGTGSVSTGTSLTVALAADTPASGLLLGNSINNKFTKVNLTASADGDIVVDSLTVRRGGTVASDGAFSSIALIDAATNIRIGNTQTINSQHMVTFNKDITVPAGTTKSVYIAGNMGDLSAKSGEIPTLDLYSVTLSGSAAVVGTLPIVGNYQNLNGTITIGALTVANGANNPDAATQKIGTTNYIVSGFKLTANSVEDFKVTQVNFDNGGTAGDGDVANMDLLVDDVIVKTISSPSDGKLYFDLSASPVTVEKGKSVQFDLQLDINDGSARTIRFDISDESDVIARGQLYGAEVKVSAGTGATADAEPFWTAPVTTIDQGALRIGPATLTAANIPEDADQLVLGKFEFEAKGEPVQITALPIAFTVTTSTGNLSTDSTVDLTNVALYDENNVIVAGPVDPTGKHNVSNSAELLVATSTDTITIPTGTHIYTVKADLDADFGTNDTIVARINPGQVTAKGETTGLSVTPTPSSDQTSATMTIQSAALALVTSPSPIAQTVVAGTKGFTFANVILGAESSGEDIKVTKVTVAIKTATANPSQVSNWSIYDGATELSTINDPDSQTSTKTTAGNSATSSFTFTTPLVIPKGTSKTLTVKGDIATNATSGTVNVGMADTTAATSHVTAKGNSTALDAAVTLSISDGQTMTFTDTGTLIITQNADTPDAGMIPAGNTSGVTIATMLAQAQREAINIEKMYITGVQVNGGGWDQVDTLYVYNGSTLLATVAPTSTDGANATALIDVTNNPILVPKDSIITLTFKADTPELNYETNNVGSGIASSWQGIQLKINAAGDVTAKGVSSGNTVSSPDVTGANGNNMYLVRSFPTISLSETGGTFPAATTAIDVHSFTVTADSAGDIGLFHVSYEVASSSASTTNMLLFSGGKQIATATTTKENGSDNPATDTSIINFFLTTDGEQVNNSGATNVLPAESLISAGSSRTYTFRMTIGCGEGCLGSGSTGSVIIKFLGDNAQVGASPTSTQMGVFSQPDYRIYEVSMLWTDWWRTPSQKRSSTTATATEQWLNAYLVKTTSGNSLSNTSTGATWSKTAQ